MLAAADARLGRRRPGRQDLPASLLPAGDRPPGTTDRVYSSAEDDIRRAQQRAIAGKGSGGPQTPTAAPDQPATGDGGGVPVPLLVLGGVAILLVALGAVGFLRRRSSDDDASTT